LRGGYGFKYNQVANALMYKVKAGATDLNISNLPKISYLRPSNLGILPETKFLYH
jgi:hypothetical protein